MFIEIEFKDQNDFLSLTSVVVTSHPSRVLLMNGIAWHRWGVKRSPNITRRFGDSGQGSTIAVLLVLIGTHVTGLGVPGSGVGRAEWTTWEASALAHSLLPYLSPFCPSLRTSHSITSPWHTQPVQSHSLLRQLPGLMAIPTASFRETPSVATRVTLTAFRTSSSQLFTCLFFCVFLFIYATFVVGIYSTQWGALLTGNLPFLAFMVMQIKKMKCYTVRPEVTQTMSGPAPCLSSQSNSFTLPKTPS